MDRRSFLKNIGLGAAVFAICKGTAAKGEVLSNISTSLKKLPRPAGSSKPNIILIMADDLGYGDIGCYGSTRIKTPNIDAMAAGGLKFTDYHSNGAVCSPTRAALLTGRYQQRCGIEDVIDAANSRDLGLALTETTFAEMLKPCGYATGLFGKWHLGYKVDFNPTKQGFDEFKGYVSGNVDYQSHIDQAKFDDWWDGTNLKSEKGYSTHLITKYGLDFIERHKNGPFCLYLAHEACHYPCQGPDDAPIREHGKPDRKMTAEKERATYITMIEEMDKGVGDIVTCIKKLGLEKDTFIFFCSDNGPAKYGSAGTLNGKKGSLLEGGHRVPGIAYWPGKIAAGNVNNETVLGMDLMATMAVMAGASGLENLKLDGVNILPVLLENKKLPARTLFWRHKGQKAVRKGMWKMVNISGTTSLYNLNDDIGESNDLATGNPEKIAELNKELADWQAQFGQIKTKTKIKKIKNKK